jgi:type IV secretion system protein VirB11
MIDSYDLRDQRAREAFMDLIEGVLADGLADSTVTEVLVNPCGSVWYDRLRGTLERQNGRDLAPDVVENIIFKIAHHLGKTVHDGMLDDAELPYYGCRVQGLLPPVVTGPTLSIRKGVMR